MESYKIVFKGELKAGVDQEKVIGPLCKFLKLPESKGHLLFSGKSLAIKKRLEHEKALKLYNAFEKLGLITHLIEEQSVAGEITSQKESSVSRLPSDASHSVQVCPHCGKDINNQSINENPVDYNNANEDSDSKLSKFKQVRLVLAVIFLCVMLGAVVWSRLENKSLTARPNAPAHSTQSDNDLATLTTEEAPSTANQNDEVTQSENPPRFDSYEALEAYSRQKYGTKDGVVVHEVN